MRSAILGVSAFYHDSAAAIVVDGRIVAAAQEERFTRVKHDASFPRHAIDYVLRESGLGLADLDAIAFYDKPFLKFERLLETYHAFAPRGVRSFLSAVPVWIKEKLFMKSMIRAELEQMSGEMPGSMPKLLFPEHHLSHAASAFYPSPFQEAAILTIDGVGEWATSTICQGSGRDITILKELNFPHSVGLLYSAFTYYCGFRVNSGEYKLMGLAPYGNKDAERVKRYRAQIESELVDIRDDGSILLNMDYFAFATELRMCRDEQWEQLFGIPRRDEESEITQPYMDMALAIQQVTEEIVLRMATTAVALTGCRQLAMAGGVALNCVANGKLIDSGVIDQLWVQPAAGDAGGAVGAALAAYHIWQGHDRNPQPKGDDGMRGAYLGPRFSDEDVDRLCRSEHAVGRKCNTFNDLANDVARLLADGSIVGWFQGRMEYGPRALGNRSILGDPRAPDMQRRLNLKIKNRESFRPFAPAVLAEQVSEYFDLSVLRSPYMLLVSEVAEERRRSLPDGYAEMSLQDRLYHIRSDIPAVTHIDYSARIQTVHREANERFWLLLRAFDDLTGCAVLVNTSFNVRDEPIVCTPADAYQCFMNTEMDYVVIGDYLFDKRDQR